MMEHISIQKQPHGQLVWGLERHLAVQRSLLEDLAPGDLAIMFPELIQTFHLIILFILLLDSSD